MQEQTTLYIIFGKTIKMHLFGSKVKYATLLISNYLIYKPTKMWQNTCFKAVFYVCFDTLIIIWEHLRPRNKLIIFFISLERPRILKNAAKMRVGSDIYLWNPT